MRVLEALLRDAIRSCLTEAKLEPGTGRIPLGQAEKLARQLADALGLYYVPPGSITSRTRWEPGRAYPVGSIRQMKEDIGDIDMIATAQVAPSAVSKLPGVSNVSGGRKMVNFTYQQGSLRRKVNLFIFTDPDTFGAALIHASGPYMYNVRIRNVAKHRGMKLSQNGLFKGGKLLAGPTEASVQEALGIKNREISER